MGEGGGRGLWVKVEGEGSGGECGGRGLWVKVEREGCRRSRGRGLWVKVCKGSVMIN